MKTTRIDLTVSNWFGVALILFGILHTESAAAADYWPTGAWRHSTPEAQGMRIAKRSGAKRARVALARRIAVILHRMWLDGTDFEWGNDACPKPA